MNKGILKPYVYTYSNLKKIIPEAFEKYKIKSIFSEISENFNEILYVKEDFNEKN